MVSRRCHHTGAMRRPLSEIATAAAAGAVLSGAPSTAHALATGRSPLAAARAAGVLLPRGARPPGLLAGGVVHVVVSAWWGTVLALVLPRRRTIAWGAAAGALIAAVDLGVVGRRVPEIASLPQAGQWADHVAFGATVGWVLSSLDAPPA